MPPFDEKSRRKMFLPCGVVAANRARRNAAKEQMPKVLVPLIAVAVFVGMMVDRLRYVFTGFGNPHIPLERQPLAPNIPNSVASPEADNADRYPGSQSIRAVKSDNAASLPLSGPTPEQAAKIVAFMIRNKGRIDNSIVESRWRELDRYSLPLAVYLRHVDAENGWHDLELDLKRHGQKSGKATQTASKRDRDLGYMIPEFIRRGHETLAKLHVDEPAAELISSPVSPDDADPPRPK